MGDTQSGQRARCERHGLVYDPRSAAGCVLCRREPEARSRSAKGLAKRATLVLLATAGVVLLGSVAVTSLGLVRAAARPPSTESVAALAPGELAPVDAKLATSLVPGRSGFLYLPARTATTPIAVLVALHGSGGDGSEMVDAFRPVASARRFAIVAPSSGFVPELKTWTWQVGDQPNEITDELRHVQACFEEVAARVDVTLDRKRVLIAGFSGGGSSAPYIATNTAPYTAFAVLHGGVFLGGVGHRHVPGWFSTGGADALRSPSHVQRHFQAMRAAGFDVVYHEYPGGHVLSPAEVNELIEWWLGSR